MIILLEGGDLIGDLDLNFVPDRLKPINCLTYTRWQVGICAVEPIMLP